MTVRTQDVSVRYGPVLAVDRVTVEAWPGQVLALLGANGSGKSSLLRALAGIQRCSGTISCEAATGIGYMPQDNTTRMGLTAFEVVLLGRLRSLALRVDERDLLAARSALAELGIEHLAGCRLGELSGGQRQLVFLAQVLAANPRVLLLDEPTSALDIAHQLHVLWHLRTATARRELTTIVAFCAEWLIFIWPAHCVWIALCLVWRTNTGRPERNRACTVQALFESFTILNQPTGAPLHGGGSHIERVSHQAYHLHNGNRR